MSTNPIFDIGTESELEEVLAETDTLLIDFWSPVCSPCKEFAPVFEKTSRRHPAVAFCRVNTREEETLSSAFGVEHVPTLLVIKNRVLVALQPGYLSEAQMDELLRQVEELDTTSLLEQDASGDVEEGEA